MSNIKYQDNNGNYDDVPPVDLDSLGFNVVGLPREIANNLNSAKQYKEVWLNFSGSYYSNARDGKDVVAGSVKVKDYTNSGAYFEINLEEVLATPGNENVQIGDEVFQIDIYSDPNHKFFIETFYFVL